MSARQRILRIAMVRCGWLLVATAALWLLLSGPAWLLAGLRGLEGLSYAAMICSVPGLLVFLMVSGYRVANNPTGPVALGMFLRMAFVLGGILLVQLVRPDLRFKEFLIWVVVFYLAMLAAETLLLIKQPRA